MHEDEIRAIRFLLDIMIKNRILRYGFEEALNLNNYPDLTDLIKAFQKICDILDEWDAPSIEIGLMQDNKCCMLDIEKKK